MAATGTQMVKIDGPTNTTPPLVKLGNSDPPSGRFRLFWLLSPFWFAAILIALSHTSPSINSVVEFLTSSPFK